MTTIIVLLILAGVAINLAIGERGIFNQSKESAAKYTQQSEIENLNMEHSAYQMEVLSGKTSKTFFEYLEDKGYSVETDGQTGTIILNGNVYEVSLANDFEIESKGPATAETLLKPTIIVAEKTKTSIKVTIKSTGATEYKYYISTDGTNYTLMNTSATNEYTYTGLTASTKYYIKVEAKNTDDVQAENSKEITTNDPVLVSGITLNETSKTIGEGTNFQLTATVSPIDADNQTVTWSSSDPTIATVGADGKVTGVKAGTVTITATANDGSGKTATCSVKVKGTVTYLNLTSGEAWESVRSNFIMNNAAWGNFSSTKTAEGIWIYKTGIDMTELDEITFFVCSSGMTYASGDVKFGITDNLTLDTNFVKSENYSKPSSDVLTITKTVNVSDYDGNYYLKIVLPKATDSTHPCISAYSSERPFRVTGK